MQFQNNIKDQIMLIGITILGAIIGFFGLLIVIFRGAIASAFFGASVIGNAGFVAEDAKKIVIVFIGGVTLMLLGGLLFSVGGLFTLIKLGHDSKNSDDRRQIAPIPKRLPPK